MPATKFCPLLKRSTFDVLALQAKNLVIEFTLACLVLKTIIKNVLAMTLTGTDCFKDVALVHWVNQMSVICYSPGSIVHLSTLLSGLFPAYPTVFQFSKTRG
jgi:hypothetical protein